jgi:hypothetical protein
MANKIDSNITGLRFAEELSLKTLPGTPVWYPLEPNSYSDFGGQITTVARNPINAARQRKKGVTTDLDASGGFNQDLTMTNTTRLLQAFMFADIREKKKTIPMNGTADTISAVTSGTKTFTVSANGTGFVANHLVLAADFTTAANNGVFTVASSTATTVVTVEAPVTEAPTAAASLSVVGFQFPSADVSITMNGSLVRLTATTTNMTTLGLIPGEWIYLGGDLAGTTFSINKGFARISAIASTYLEFDKISWTGAGAEVGTGKTIRIFYGDVIKNESTAALIKRRTLQIERTLGDDGSGTQSEYLVGAVANELGLTIAQADKVTMDLSFVAVDNEQRTGATGVKSGTRPTLVQGSAFNTSSDFARIKLALVSATDPAPLPLFAFATEMKLDIKNGVSPNKAIGVLGAFDTSVGTFEVGGSLTAYFASTTAVSAVRNNSDVTLDVIMQKKNKALLWDVPLLSLGDGRLSVEQDQPITLPLETTAAESKFGHTLLFQTFNYLPDAAGGV